MRFFRKYESLGPPFREPLEFSWRFILPKLLFVAEFMDLKLFLESLLMALIARGLLILRLPFFCIV
jgi:hypothetical protein